MDFERILQARQSCRAFDPARTPSRAQIEQVLEAARLAPSACNSQPYHFWVAAGEAAARLGACTRSMGMNRFTQDCPVFIAVGEEPYNRSAAVGAKLKDQDYRAADIGIAVAFLTARAAELGLGTCILGWFDEKRAAALLGTDRRVRLIVALGYAREGDPLRPKTRKEAAQLVTWL